MMEMKPITPTTKWGPEAFYRIMFVGMSAAGCAWADFTLGIV